MSGDVVTYPANVATPAEWAERINAAWNKSLDGILECGRLLVEAKAALSHGEFLPTIDALSFGARTAQRLMDVASDGRLATYTSHLPPSWMTLYEITKMDDGALEEAVDSGLIHPGMKQSDIRKYRRIEKRADDEARVMDLEAAPGKFKTIVIDPPWDYEWLSLAGRAAPGYATMSHDELKAVPVPGWADENCHLYLWTTNNFITRAVDLMAHWGFEHKTVLTWVKPRWGLGSYFRNSTEQVLFGVKGHMPTRRDDIATHFDAPVGEHSVKPDEFYDIVLRASYPPYGEAFQRTARTEFENLYRVSEAA